mgnify:FL=1
MKLAVICFGANDSVQEGGEGGEDLYVPLPLFKTNMEDILSAFRAHNPSVCVILVTPPTVNSQLWPNRSPHRTAAYAQVVRDVGKGAQAESAVHVQVLDLWAEGERERGAVNVGDLCDGIHLASSGNDKVRILRFRMEEARTNILCTLTLYP